MIKQLECNDILNGACITDGNCGTNEFCDHDFPNPVGKCSPGLLDGKACLRDRYCESKRCHLFVCEKRMQLKDGPCKIEADCPDDQYCHKIPDTDGLHICADRKNSGSCLRDKHCLSNRCHLFQCVKQ